MNISPEEKDRYLGLATADMSIDDLLSFVNDFPALLWRVEIPKSRIEFLNNNYIVARGLDGKLLMKSIQYQKKMLLEEDAYLLNAFMGAVKEARTTATVFRTRTEYNEVVWLKLTGAANSWDPRYYYGFLLNVTDTVEVIKNIVSKDINLQLLVDDTDNPALIVDYESQGVICFNPEARQLFGKWQKDLGELRLDDLYRESMNLTMKEIMEKVLLNRKWKGKLDFYQNDKRGVFSAEATIRYLLHNSRKLLRISFSYPQVKQKPVQGLKPKPDVLTRKYLDEKIQKTPSDISKIMQAALSCPLIDKNCHGILFSDIHIRKNKVFVYWAGQPFADLKQGEPFSFKGSIAEEINRFELSHLALRDTQESIKPIDWVLFVPHGIRSYFARPFYSRKVLRTVFILCSKTASAFTGYTAHDFDEL
ncbi:MAG: hypothetical protein ACLFMP_02830, partial [Desulfonatronovibrionaceae bacterium]